MKANIRIFTVGSKRSKKDKVTIINMYKIDGMYIFTHEYADKDALQNNEYFRASEWMSGYLIGKGNTEEKAIKDARDKTSSHPAWKDKLAKVIYEHGIANQGEPEDKK